MYPPSSASTHRTTIPSIPMYRSKSHSAKMSGRDRTNSGTVPPLPQMSRPGTPGKPEYQYDYTSKGRENFTTNPNIRPKATESLRRSKTPTPTSSSWTSTPSYAYANAYSHSYSNATPRVYVYDDGTGPWAETVNTYTWVLEQEYREMMRQKEQEQQARTRRGFGPVNGTTVETHYFGLRNDKDASEFPIGMDLNFDPMAWEQQAHEIDMQARMWMLQEEARRTAALRQAEQTRIVQDEVRKLRERIMRKRELERQRAEEERRRQEAFRERERRRVRAKVEHAWKVYDARWASISAITASQPLTFASIPWPVIEPPKSPSSLTLSRISAFILSDAHSKDHTPRERIKEALRRWHPDRFGRLLNRVVETDRATVEEGVGIVARCLNELLSRQS